MDTIKDTMLKSKLDIGMKLFKTLLLTAFMISAGFSSAFCQVKAGTGMTKPRYVKVPAGYLMVLQQGDSLLIELERFAKLENIPSANFTGMGFVNMEFGFYNAKTKKFDPKEFKAVELASMNGTIATQKRKVSIHAHGVVTDKNFKAFGGHILSATVGTGSIEILIIVHDRPFERVFDEGLGANVLQIN
jgi:predicted DNA-binding protein with PD1-like motif